MFSNQQLKHLIITLFIEQLLITLVGIVDTFIISYAGEAAVSGVSLVNSFNTVFIYLFSALAAGGAVIVSQYVGKKSYDKASESVSQLLMLSVVLSIVLSVIILIWDKGLLELLFGKVDEDVMDACMTYLRISVYSYPALAIYHAGAALYRSIGKTSATMYISLASNVINVIGNIIGVFYFHAGVAGVAYPSLIARAFSAVMITALCFQRKNEISFYIPYIFRWNGRLIKSILGIAVPNGVESGLHQCVKVALSSIVALFGTSQIAANGVAQTFWNVAALVGLSMGPVFITVIGQCMGAEDTEQAEKYFYKLMKITVIFSIVWNVVIFAVTPLILNFYAISAETRHLVIILVLIHNLGSSVIFPFADPLGKGLRAAGDVKFTLAVSLISTIGVRLALSILFAIILNMGVVGLAYAMCAEWIVRTLIYWFRFKQNKWKNYKLI